jgi:hypothetical protein
VKVLKRSSLTADHFEKLVFVKGNMHLLKKRTRKASNVFICALFFIIIMKQYENNEENVQIPT